MNSSNAQFDFPLPLTRRDDIKLCIDIARAFNDNSSGSDDDVRFYKTSLMARLATGVSQPVYPNGLDYELGVKELWELYEPYAEFSSERKALLISCWANILTPDMHVTVGAIMKRYYEILLWQKVDGEKWKNIDPSYPDPFSIIAGEVALGQIKPE